MKSRLISVIVPCYNEGAALPLFLDALRNVSAELRDEFSCKVELLFIDDGSRDGTLSVLREAARTEKNVRYLSFSRNFGKEAAMYAGLQRARGDYVVVMDADLQHPPAMLREMVTVLNSGEYDCAAARRVSRDGEPPLRSFFSRRFYRLMNRISDTEVVEGACDFRMMTRRMVDAILSLKEYNRFSKGIFSWVGFRTKWIPFENRERVAGETKWSFWGLLVYAVQGIVGFSTVPLALVAVLGALMCVGSLLTVAYIIVKTLLFGDPVGGWPSMACMVMFLGGVQLFCMGILGEYLAKTYLEVKRRPIYVLSETDADSVTPDADADSVSAGTERRDADSVSAGTERRDADSVSAGTERRDADSETFGTDGDSETPGTERRNADSVGAETERRDADFETFGTDGDSGKT